MSARTRAVRRRGVARGLLASAVALMLVWVPSARPALAVQPPGPPDPANSTISGTGPVVADGVATSTIAITLKDSSGTAVDGVTPTFSGTGSYNSYGPCSATDLSGVSTCTLASTKAEVKTLAITSPAMTPAPTGTVSFIPGPYAQLQVLVPGEAAMPGSTGGKSGTPLTQTIGVPFNVTVYAVDARWNVVGSVGDNVGITSSDAAAGLPLAAPLNAGARQFSVALGTASSTGWTVTASDLTDGTTTGTSSPIPVDAFVGLVVVLPGQSLGSGTGCRTGTPDAQAAGTAFTVTVYAVDPSCLQVTTASDTVALTSSDTNASMPASAALVGGRVDLSVTLVTAGSRTITATDAENSAKASSISSPLTVSAGAFTKLQLLVPGETAAPGTSTGKTGSPSTQTAGTAFTITVNAVDAYWNRVGSIAHTVRITSSAAPSSTLAQGALSGGTTTFGVTLTGASGQTLAATDVTDGTKTADTSPPIPLDTFVGLRVLLPGESLGSTSPCGKTGSPSAQTAGGAFNATVYAVGLDGCPVTTSDTVAITSSDANAVLPASASLGGGSSKTFSVTLRTASTAGWTITARDVTNPAKSAGTSAAVVVNAAAYAKLQVLVPGETAAPGTSAGKTGTPSTQTAGTAFTITVNAVDAYWNRVTSITHTVKITSSDSAATLPSNNALAAGSQTFSVTLRTTSATGWTLTATDQASGYTSIIGTSSAIPTIAGTIKLQILLPGETAAPNTTTGKTGTPTAQTAGTAFTVTVNAVDANWNKVTSVTDTAAISSSDANAVLPSSAALVGGTKTFTVTLKTAGSRTVTASDLTYTTRAASTSSYVTIIPATFTKLQLLVPGEYAAPGTSIGKTGSPSSQRSAVPFTVTVNAVDAYWNVVGSVTHTVRITSSDGGATLPANAALSSGTRTFSVTLRTPPSQTVTAVDITDGTKTASTSPAITILGAPATLTLSTTAGVIVWGSGFTLTARFSASGAYRAVTLQASIDGANWTPLTTLTADALGSASYYYRAARNLWYRASFAGATDLGAGVSLPVRVVVRQIALLRPTLSGKIKTIASGTNITFTTTVRPARPELPKAKVSFTFTLYRSGHVIYSGKRDLYIDSAGLARWTWTFGSRGLWYVRAIANPTTTNANSVWSQIERYYVP